jgi:hypothetical protein
MLFSKMKSPNPLGCTRDSGFYWYCSTRILIVLAVFIIVLAVFIIVLAARARLTAIELSYRARRFYYRACRTGLPHGDWV